MPQPPRYPFVAPGNSQQSTNQEVYRSQNSNNPFAPHNRPRGPNRLVKPQPRPTIPPNLRHNPFVSAPISAPKSVTPVSQPTFSPSRAAPLPSNGPSGRDSSRNMRSSGLSAGPVTYQAPPMRTLSIAPDLGQLISEKYFLGADPSLWGTNLTPDVPEPDDDLHNPDPRRDRRKDHGGTVFTLRGVANLGCVVLLAVGLVALLVGYPLISYLLAKGPSTNGAYNIGGINATGQIPSLTGNWGLIDADTPIEAHKKISYTDGEEWVLVFSDEFNVDGRSFYPGDDPYWEAVDLWYWQTGNMEWYDPRAVTTADGNLVITINKTASNGFKYESGMITSWNKFCFTGGLLEASATLPGASDVWGLWPAIWTMGNLGRAGYGASNDGLWPYSYDTCDVGTLKNQTRPDGTPHSTLTGGEKGKSLNWLSGQRLSACTCSGEAHPGPKRPDGSFVGRGAPEIDILEAKVNTMGRGHNSQSAQWAPFNYKYKFDNSSENVKFYDSGAKFKLNNYRGGIHQQATSGFGPTNQDCYELKKGCHAIYGFEYRPGNDGFITWINDGKISWTLRGAGMGPDKITEIGQRPVPVEPMYIVMNLALSYAFSSIDLKNLIFPAKFMIDYVRVYQPKNNQNIGCSPKDYPTEEYINAFPEAYSNPKLIEWVKGYNQTWPKNKLVDRC